MIEKFYSLMVSQRDTHKDLKSSGFQFVCTWAKKCTNTSINKQHIIMK